MEKENQKEKLEVEIRVVQPEDVEGMLNVSYKTWLDIYPNEEAGITVDDIKESFKDSFTEESIRSRQERIENLPANEWRVVAKVNEVVVGFATMVRNEEYNQLRSIYILPEFQGKGIGTMLWNEVKMFADPTKNTIVQVVTYNEQAIGFYQKLGFEDTGKRFIDERFRMPSGNILPEMEMVLRQK
jgi:ribosomal protein S18 acetylase RimI-like enzyme